MRPCHGGDHRRRHDGRRHRDGVRERGLTVTAERRVAGRRSTPASPRSAETTRCRSSAGRFTPARSASDWPHQPQLDSTTGRRGRFRHRGRLREHGPEAQDLPRARRRRQARRDSRDNTSTLDIDADRRGDVAAGRRSSACISSARQTSCGCSKIVRGRADQRPTCWRPRSPRQALGKVGVVVGNGPRLRRQPDDVPVHVRDAVPRRGGRDAGTGRSRADEVRHGDGDVRGGRHGGHGRGVARPPGARALQRPARAATARRRSVVRDRPATVRKPARAGIDTTSARKPTPDPEVVALIRSLAAEPGVPQRSISDEEIVERSIFALVNEGARVARGGHRLPRIRHRRDLRQRLRLPVLARRPDVLRRSRRPAGVLAPSKVST